MDAHLFTNASKGGRTAVNKNYESWEAGNFKELELGTLFAMQCLMKSERCWSQTLEQFLAFSFALDLPNQLHALCILHLPLKTFGQLAAGICQIRRGRPQNWEEIFNFRVPLQGQQRGRAFCFGCWVLWQCSSSRRSRRGSAWPICATHRLLPTFDICHNHLHIMAEQFSWLRKFFGQQRKIFDMPDV